MAVEELCLTWDDHHKAVIGVFEKLLESGSLVDCTIAAEGQYLKAHKVILSACSPYFEMLFNVENEKNPIIILKDVTFQDLKALIDFIYRGKVQIPEDRLGDFTNAAETLQIRGLGGGHRRHVSDKKGVDSLRKESHVSPVPCKRMRRSYSNERRQNMEDVSPECAGPSSQIAENSLQQIIPPEEPSCSISSQTFASDTTSSLLSQALKLQKEISGTRASVSDSRHCVEALPESWSEIYVTETEGLIVPKNELCVEETPILESEDEMQDVILRDVENEESSNSVYSSAQGAVKDDLHNSYLLGRVLEQSNTVEKAGGNHCEPEVNKWPSTEKPLVFSKIDLGMHVSCAQSAYKAMCGTNSKADWAVALLHGVFGEDARFMREKSYSMKHKTMSRRFKIVAGDHYRKWLLRNQPHMTEEEINVEIEDLPSYLSKRAEDMNGREEDHQSRKTVLLICGPPPGRAELMGASTDDIAALVLPSPPSEKHSNVEK